MSVSLCALYIRIDLFSENMTPRLKNKKKVILCENIGIHITYKIKTSFFYKKFKQVFIENDYVTRVYSINYT